MYYYFYADFPSVIKINGIYYGSCHGLVKKLGYEGDAPPFIELYSLTPDEKSAFLLLNKNFFDNPPENVAITDLSGGYLIRFKPCFIKAGFEILAQKKHPYAVVTVFNDNGLNISIETPNDFYTERVKFDAKSAEIKEFNLNGTPLLAVEIFKQDKTLLCIFDVNDKVKKIFSRTVNEYSFSDTFSTTETFLDIQKHSLSIVWEYDNNCLKEKSRSITCAKEFDLTNLNEHVIPYAFLESLLVGDNVECFLGDEIKQNLAVLPEYLGNFIGVFPPPDFIEQQLVGLVYKQKENVYSVKYFNFTVKDKKIINVDKI